MRKPGDVHTIHRFQSFSERIQTVNVDVSRKIEKRAEVPEDQETFFEEGLLKWRDLDQTAHFTKFFNLVQGCTQTFAQLLHNEQKVVDLLLEHLQVQDSMALEALLDLVVQFARDLQKDFYTHFGKFFAVIATILNNSLKSWEVLEQAFTCLSYLFKFLWRKMVQDIKKVMVMYQPFLSEKYRDYVRRFAAESLSYLMRKVKDKTHLFGIVFSHLDKHPDLVPGVGNLIFEMVKGPKAFFHSCAEDTLGYLLRTVGEQGTSSLQFLALTEAFRLMAEHVDQSNTDAVWNVLQTEISGLVAAEPSSTSTSRLQSVSTNRLQCVSMLLFYMVDYKHGCLLPRPCTSWCGSSLLPLIQQTLKPDSSQHLVSTVLNSLSSLLLAEKTRIDTSSVVRCLSLIYSKDCVRSMEEVFRFTESLFDYTQFEKDVLRRLLDYCSECLRLSESPSDSQSQVLAVLGRLILNKRPEIRDGLHRPLHRYPLTTKPQGDAVSEYLVKTLTNPDIDNDLEKVWGVIIIAPHYTSLKQEVLQPLLDGLCSQMCQRLLSAAGHSPAMAAVASQCLQACLWVNESALSVPVFELLQTHSTCPHVLRLAATYLTYHQSTDAGERLLTRDQFSSLYPSLRKNISSHKSQVRVLTLRILSMFSLRPPRDGNAEVEEDVSEEVRDGVFTLCLRSEEQEATLNNYREKLRLLRHLHYDLISSHLPADGTLDDVPLRYLSAVLYVNFSMLWPETLTLIESHGKSLTRETLWGCYTELLTAASGDCLRATDVPSGEETECECPCPLTEVFSGSQCHHENAASDRPDFSNHRELLWRAMHGFPSKCEPSSKAIVELFFQFLETEYYIAHFFDAPIEDISKRVTEAASDSMEVDDEGVEADAQPAGKPAVVDGKGEGKKRTKIIHQTLITKLTLFSKFHHPMRISQEPRLTKLYNDLLLHRDMAIQQVSLKCLMTYKKKHLVQYAENFENLLNDSTFRTELTMFSIDVESSVVKAEDRSTVMPVLLRILYGRMLHSTGKETKGRGGRGDLRRTIVLSFLAGCREEELSILLDLVVEPLVPLLREDYVTTLELARATPPRRILGILSTITAIMEKLGHLLTSHLHRLLHILLCVIRYAAFLLDKRREEMNFSAINSLKVARQTAIKGLSQFMDSNTEYEFSQAEVTAIFDVAVWPQLPRLAFEGTSAPTSLLSLIETWTHYRRYLPLLLKVDPLTSDYPLSSVMRLLASPFCKISVGSLIMELVGNILDFHTLTSSSSTAMETDGQLLMPVGDIVEVNDSAGSYEVGMLIPHLSTIINYIKDRVSKATIKGTNQTAFPMKELNILSICSQFVDAPELCGALLTRLLPFLMGGCSRLSEEIQCGIIRTLGNLARKTADVDQQLCKLLPLCSSLTQRLSRMELVKMFESLRELSSECKEVAELVREMNAFDGARIEEPDYDSRLGAFREIVWWDYEKCGLSLVVAIIHNSCFTLRHVDDMALRDSASAALQVLVKKMPAVHYEKAINSHLVPLVRLGIQLRRDTVRSEFLAILRDMVNSRPDIYTDMVGLTNEDNVEDDFWENIRHIQVSRRLKGLNRLMRHLGKVQMKSVTLTKYLLPLVFSFIKEETDYHKKNAMVDVCIATVGALCYHLPWAAYKAQLRAALNLLNKIENNKMAVRLLCTILDAFHYDVSLSTYVETQVGKEIATDVAGKRKKSGGPEEKMADSERPVELPISHQANAVGAEAIEADVIGDDVDEGIDLESETHDTKSLDSVTAPSSIVRCDPDLATSIHSHIIGSILPQLHQTLTKKASTDDLHKDNKSIHPDQAEIQRVPLAIAIVKVLQKISSGCLERHLPSVLMKVCYFIKSRAEDIRDAARQTLAKILGCLGMSYMSTITEHLRSSLVKGYQVNVLGYSLHYILNQNMKMIKPGDLTPCLHSLVSINMNGLFGFSSYEKDIDKHDTSKEKRKPQYYELFGLLARYSTPSTIAVILIPLKEKLDCIHKAKDMSKLRQSLDKVADGLLLNTGLTAEQYLKFTYGLVSESVTRFFQDKRARRKANAEAKQKEKEKTKQAAEDTFIIPAEPGRSQPLPPTLKKSNKHVLVEFGMKLFHMLLKKAKVLFGSEEHAKMVDPFVPLLIESLTSEHIPVIVESLICLTFVIKFKALPSLVSGMEKVITGLFVLLQTYSASGTTAGEGFDLCQLCFRLISIVLKTCSYYQWTEDKIEVLLSYAESDILDHNRRATAFSLLKAIISRKLLCKLLYEVVKKVEELSVKSESSDIRLNCRQVVLQFLLDYPLGKGLPKHINFFLDNLDYEAEHGRESIYEMLGAMLTAFPQKTIHTYSSTLFISLARARVNDESEKCRKLAALGIKTLLGRVERNCRTKLFAMAFAWLQESRVEIVQMAAQIMGLFIEVECDAFSSRFNNFLPVLEKALQPQIYATSNGESDSNKDLQLYHLILLTMKMIRECPRVLRQPSCDQLLGHIKQHMLHPHAWVRFATAQVFGLVFSTYNPDELVAAALSHSSTDKQQTTPDSNGQTSTKSHKTMTFLLTDIRQKLRDFSADFCTQLSSQFMEEEFAAQIVKNLVFLVKVIRRLPEARDDEDTTSQAGAGSDDDIPSDKPAVQPTDPAVQPTDPAVQPTDPAVQPPDPSLAEPDGAVKKQSLSIDWLIRRLGKVAVFEATNSPRQSTKRSNVFKCLAAIAMELGPHLLQNHLKNILPPIHRELTMVKLFPETEDLRNLANEVSTLLKTTVGVSVYSAEYASVHQAATLRKADRKRKLAQQAIMHPSITANKKMRMHLRKGTSKRHAQKDSKFKGNKYNSKPKKRTIARDMAILQ